MKNDQIAKLICYGVGCAFALYIIWTFLPYIVLFLALCGAWHLFQECKKNDRNRGGRCR